MKTEKRPASRRPLAPSLLLLLVLAACNANKVTGELEFGPIGDAAEIELGRNAAPGIEAQYGEIYDDPALNAFVSEVGMKLAKASHWPTADYRFVVLNSPVINSFALPGGRVYITRGLLARLGNESQLAGVLGHEIGHVAAGDCRERISKMMAGNVLLTASSSSTASGGTAEARKRAAAISVLDGAVDVLAIDGYGPEAEDRADALGAAYCAKTGYHPRGMAQVLLLLRSLQREKVAGVDAFFRSHAINEKRIAELERQLKERYPDANDGEFVDVGESFKKRMATFAAGFKTWELYDAARIHRAKGNVPRALQLVNEALTALPDHPALLTERGAIYLALNRHADAEIDFRKAKERNPRSYECRLGCGICLLNDADLGSAEAEFSAAVALLNDRFLGHYYLAETRYRMKKYDEAKEGFLTTLDLTEDLPYAPNARRRLQELGVK